MPRVRSPEAAAHEAARKAEYHRKRKVDQMAKKAAAAPKRPVRSLVIADLDTTYADAVRAGDRDPFHVNRLRKAYEDNAPVPPVVVVTWPNGRLFLADGGFRRLAKLEAKATRIPAEVVECRNEADARREALAIAAGSNEHPGKTRSSDDLRASIAAYITAPWNEKDSDGATARAVRTHHAIVRLVREKLSHDGTIPPDSPAHASKRPYKDGAKLGGGMVADGKGGKVAAPALEPVARPEQTVGTFAPEPTEDPADPPETLAVPADGDPFDDDTPPPAAPAIPAKAVNDARGRRVPDAIAHLFDGATDAHAVCPHVNDDGLHRQTDNPKQCLVCRGRMVVTPAEFALLSDDLRNLCDGRDPTHDQRDDDRLRQEQNAVDRLKRCQELHRQLEAAVGRLGQSAFHLDLLTAAKVAGEAFCVSITNHAITGEPLPESWHWGPLGRVGLVLAEVEAAYRRRVVDRADAA